MDLITEIKNDWAGYLNPDSLPVFVILSLVIGFVLLIVGLVLKAKSKGKSTAAWVCIGIGALSVISNVIQLIVRFA